MADLSAFKAGIERARNESTIDHVDPRMGFHSELTGLGYKVPQGIIEGKIQRIDAPDDDRGDRTGWYIFNTFADYKDAAKYIGIGTYGSWRDGGKTTWSSRNIHTMSFQDRSSYNNAVEQARIARDSEQEKIYADAAIAANERWNLSASASDSFPYLVRKQVKSYALREYNGNLIIPVMSNGKIQSLQEIKPDGFKRNFTGGKMKGGYFKLPGHEETIYVAEGYATAASIAEATGSAVYVSYTAGNLYEVCTHVQSDHNGSRIVICGDDDTGNKINVGRDKAAHAGESLGLEVIFPVGVVDMNDYAVANGLQALKDLLTKPPVAAYEEKKSADDLNLPSGFLLDIFNFYNAVSGNHQPGFALQTALAISSLILGRSFRTNKDNFTSLYLLNVGLSSTGKETAKSVVEWVLDATGHGNLIGGDGYTSQGAVMSALLDRPKHITVIDEFGRYLEASANANNHHQQQANTAIMEAFGRCGGITRPMNYSSMAIKKDAADAIKDRKVYNPSLTLLAMTTPDRLYSSLGLKAVKDGFINRILINISDTTRDIRLHKDRMAVPERIIDWAKSITLRNPETHNASEEASPITINFTGDAAKSEIEFQRYCIAEANKLDKHNMAELTGRSNEIAMRISLIHALSRNPKTETVEKEDMDWAISYVKRCLEKTISVMKMNISGSEHESDKKEILQALRAASPEYIRFSAMLKQSPYSKYKKDDLKKIMDTLVEAGLVDERQSAGNGRPTKEYMAVS